MSEEKDETDAGLAEALRDPGFSAFMKEQYSAFKAKSPATERPASEIKTVLDQKLADPNWPDDLKIETSIVLKKKTWKQLVALMAAHAGEREWRTLSGSVWQLVQNAYLNRVGRQKAKEAQPKEEPPEDGGGDPQAEHGPEARVLQVRDLK